ncbi:MAG: alpha/beta hydrolase [Acidobacteriota bacterium]
MYTVMDTIGSRLRTGLLARLLPAALLLTVASATAQKPESFTVQKTSLGLTEVGVLGGAAYRIDIPENWNHSLIVYYHGYAERPVSFHLAERLEGRQGPLLERHYAIVQSAYSQPGWALEQAYPETELLRRYFLKKYGLPKETYVAGASMGGMLVTIALELNPKAYEGGLDLCGSVGPTFQSFDRRFALRAAFDHYFPGLLPPLVPTPVDYMQSPAMLERIEVALKANPDAATIMRGLTSVHTNVDLAWDMDYFTFNISDMQHRAKGNPFDNRNYLYTGTNPANTLGDFELNDKVRRYAASPTARAYLLRHYSPSGRLGKPMIALHTLYDPIVPPTSLAFYDHQVQAAGSGENLVQQYVHREGHCNLTVEEIGRAFDELVAWTHKGARPSPGLEP